ncbi:hypothetical protein V8B97DRAFT_2108527 [Scleroderma yunnanense]
MHGARRSKEGQNLSKVIISNLSRSRVDYPPQEAGKMTHKDVRAGAMMSKVGCPQIYESNEQRTSPHTNHNLPKKINGARENAYFDIEEMYGGDLPRSLRRPTVLNRDERKIGKILEMVWKQRPYDESKIRSMDPKCDPLGPATVHGNKPSRGAKIDAELKAAEEEELRKKAQHRMGKRGT